MNRLTRRAMDFDDIILSVSINRLEQAMQDVMKMHVAIYTDPWDIAREKVDDERVLDKKTQAHLDEQMQIIEESLTNHVAVLVDSVSGDILATYTTFDELLSAAKAAYFDTQADDVATLCDELNDMVFDQNIERRYAYAGNLEDVEDELFDNAWDYADTPNMLWADEANAYLVEHGVDFDAAYIIYIGGTYVNCRNANDLVEKVIGITGDKLINLLAELKKAA